MRAQQSIQARKNIAPQIYAASSFSNSDLAHLMVRTQLIRSKLSELGYIVGDDQVEAQVKSTEQRLGLGREKLLQFLRQNNTTFDEYFELIRESIEYSIFFQRVITPLISITEQEVKNTFYRENLSANKTLSFRYGLVDFSLDKDRFKGDMLDRFTTALKKFQNEGELPSEYRGTDNTEIGDITEEGLSKEVKDLLKNTDEGSFSKPTLIGPSYHVFFVKKKDLVESEIFQRSKDQIRERIFLRLAKDMIDVWHQREENKHYVKYFL